MIVDTIENKKRAAEILLVEDNPGDVILARKAFAKAKITNNVTVATNGKDALTLLRQEIKGIDPYMPDIILLDLNLPQKSGREVLEEIKSDERLRHIPVVVLTSSRAELDVVKSYNLHANGYIIKPVNLEKFNEIVHSIEQFWFTVVVLSDEQRSA